MINAPPAAARRSTCDLIWPREATANVPEPDTSRRSSAGATAANSWRTRCSARSCASRSAPAARVVSTITARDASRDTQTCPSLRGAWAGNMLCAMRTDSPVGSRRITALIIAPAGVPSIDVVSSIPARRPSTVKR